MAFWITLARSVLATALGLALILQPEKTRPMLVNFMGMFWLMAGIMSLCWGAYGARRWWRASSELLPECVGPPMRRWDCRSFQSQCAGTNPPRLECGERLERWIGDAVRDAVHRVGGGGRRRDTCQRLVDECAHSNCRGGPHWRSRRCGRRQISRRRASALVDDWRTAAICGAGALIEAYLGSGAFGGNGFVAAFVAGIAFGAITRTRLAEGAEYTETTGTLLSLLVWTIFGAVFIVPAALALFDLARGVWPALLSCFHCVGVPRCVGAVTRGVAEEESGASELGCWLTE